MSRVQTPIRGCDELPINHLSGSERRRVERAPPRAGCANLDLAGVRSYIESRLRGSCGAPHDRSVESEGAAMAWAHDGYVFEPAFVQGTAAVRAAIVQCVELLATTDEQDGSRFDTSSDEVSLLQRGLLHDGSPVPRGGVEGCRVDADTLAERKMPAEPGRKARCCHAEPRQHESFRSVSPSTREPRAGVQKESGRVPDRMHQADTAAAATNIRPVGQPRERRGNRGNDPDTDELVSRVLCTMAAEQIQG